MQASRLRGSGLPARPFCVTVLLLSLLTAYSWLSRMQQRHGRPHDHGSSSVSLFRRDGEPECGDVHDAHDQCAFVRQNCADDDAGLLPYLHLYYCALSRAKPVAFALLVVWLGLLFTTIGIAASDFFSVNLSTIAAILGLSESLAGVTFLAFGNGSPDVFSTFAAMSSNSPSMAVGELIGAASFISGVVTGSMALVREFRVSRKTYTRDLCFFIVAVAFTMTFLADGQLRFWECWTMVGYYVIYVVTVVGWHWYAARRKRRRRREGEARSNFYAIAAHAGDELAGEPYRDDPDNLDRVPGRSPGHSPGDVSPLDQGLSWHEADGQTPELESGGVPDDDADGDRERMVAAEITRNMRLLRTGPKRHHNMNPIRPSLVGALEFRSALAHLQRESNLPLSPILGRSYSENDPHWRAHRETVSVVPDSHHDPRDALSTPGAATTRRDRALSSGDAPISSADIPDLLGDAPAGDAPALLLSEGSDGGQRTPTPTPSYTVGGNLDPPPARPPGVTGDGSSDDSPGQGPLTRLRLQIQSRRSSHGDMPRRSSPFPRYTDSPMPMTPNARSEQTHVMLPPSAAARLDGYFPDLLAPTQESCPVRWWPYAVLPSPHVLLATLFPTLQGWREKTHWDRFLSTISVPSIFLLVITLPVVNSETNEGACADETIADDASLRGVGHVVPAISVEPREIEHSVSRSNGHDAGAKNLANLASLEHDDETAIEATASKAPGQPLVPAKPASDMPSASNTNESAPWNRWLVCLQLFIGPLFVVFIVWVNLSEEWERLDRELVRMVLYTLVGSLVLLAMLLLTTTEHTRPRFHYLFCFLGFIISIAWISTVVDEVMGVLKAFGVILGISEALLGLTVFAAGNSIGDLVADITVARLGYPVMALSACFGGPMFNILLGIGIGGIIMMVQDANRQHAKHPERPMQYEPYRVQVGGTLMISSITLLIILGLLLVVVPMNRWILSRKIGWGLIALWTVSTVVSVVIEVTGIWSDDIIGGVDEERGAASSF